MERDKTLFQIKVHEHFSKKTKKGAASTGVFIIFISVVVGIAGTLGWDEFGYWMFGLGMLLSPIAAIVGVIYIIVNLLRPTRKVICASCKCENSIFRTARSYVCPNCNQLLLLGEETTKQPAFFPVSTAVSKPQYVKTQVLIYVLTVELLFNKKIKEATNTKSVQVVVL